MMSGQMEGMPRRPAQRIDGPSGQPGIGVEGDDVPDVGRRDGRRATRRQKAGVRCASKEAIQLMELPALSLPPHPRLLALIPEPAAVEEEESLAALQGIAIVRVQTPDPLARRCQSLLVTGRALRGRIRPVGQKSETNIAVRIRQ